MIARKDLFQAVRSGAFVPFPHTKITPLDLKSQLQEIAEAIPASAMAQLLYCLLTKTDDLPLNLIAKERLFFRHFIKAQHE
jgi:hypothetical protein